MTLGKSSPGSNSKLGHFLPGLSCQWFFYHANLFLYLLVLQKELLLRIKLSVVTLGKSLPGSNSKLGHFLTGLSCQWFFYHANLFLYLLVLQKELLLRIKLSVVTLGKSLPGSNSKLGHFLPGLSCQWFFYHANLFLYLLVLQKEWLLRIKLSVVTLGKSLPGSNSKLGHFLPGLSCQWFFYHANLFLYLLVLQKELLLRIKLSVVTLGKSLPGSNSKLGHFLTGLSCQWFFYHANLFLYLLVLQKELLLRIKLSVVTLGKSLPGSKSKLGHFLPGLSCQWFFYHANLFLYLLALQKELLLWELSCLLWPWVNPYLEATANWGIFWLGFLVNDFSIMQIYFYIFWLYKKNYYCEN